MGQKYECSVIQSRLLSELTKDRAKHILDRDDFSGSLDIAISVNQAYEYRAHPLALCLKWNEKRAHPQTLVKVPLRYKVLQTPSHFTRPSLGACDKELF